MRSLGPCRRRLERARKDADLLLQVVDNTSAVIYLRDSGGRYLLVNRQYEQLFSINRSDIVGLTDHDLFPAEMADTFRANDIKALTSGAPLQMEEVAPHADGPHSYITVKYPIVDSAGRPYAVCGISTDITVLKQAEAEVRRLNADLERQVVNRTAELEASTRELDTFVYSVSHDLKAPLRAISGFSEVLLRDYRDRLDGAGLEYLERMAAATNHVERLIDDLLDLSRAGRVELRRRPVDLTQAAEAVVAELREAEPDRAASVEVRIDPGMHAVGDPLLLTLVVQNLVANAWKFTATTPQARIHVGASGQDGVRVFFVRDNGVGFEMKDAGKLFTPFQRLHTADEFAGSGIGLAIVGRIIARHGGRVWAESRPGHSTTFHFTLSADKSAG